MANKLETKQENRNNQTSPDGAKIMFDALVQIAHSEAFFDGEKRLVKIAQRAIQRVTKVNI